MEEYKKDDRGRSKAKRLTETDPHTKVDSSTWTPSAPENAGVKTGARPLVKRLYKKGGKVVGKHEGKDAVKHAGRMPRKAGGRTNTLSPDSLINRDVRTANEAREGTKHIGGFKKGGKAHKFGGGPIGDNPVGEQNRMMGKAAGMMKKGGKVHKKWGGKSTGVETDFHPSTYGEEKVNYSDKDNEAVSNIAKYGSARGNPTASPDYPERKRGGNVKHNDEAQDKKLMHKVLKPTVFKAKGGKAMHHDDCTCKMCGGGRTMKYGGGGVFSGDSKGKVPGVVPGGRMAKKGGGESSSMYDDPNYWSGAHYELLGGGWKNLDKATPDQIAAMNEKDRAAALAAQSNAPVRTGSTPNTSSSTTYNLAKPTSKMVGSGRGVSGPTADQIAAERGIATQRQQQMANDQSQMLAQRRNEQYAYNPYAEAGPDRPAYSGPSGAAPNVNFTLDSYSSPSEAVRATNARRNAQNVMDVANQMKASDPLHPLPEGMMDRLNQSRQDLTGFDVYSPAMTNRQGLNYTAGSYFGKPAQAYTSPLNKPTAIVGSGQDALDQMNTGAYKRGGKVGKTNVNIIIATGKGQQPQGMMGGAPMPNAPVNPMRQPQQQPQMPPQGGMPPQGMPPMPPQGGMPMPRKHGGRTGYPIDSGSGGGEARLEKRDAYGLKPARKSGGRTSYPIETGSGGANARLEKISAYGLKPSKRK